MNKFTPTMTLEETEAYAASPNFVNEVATLCGVEKEGERFNKSQLLAVIKAAGVLGCPAIIKHPAPIDYDSDFFDKTFDVLKRGFDKHGSQPRHS